MWKLELSDILIQVANSDGQRKAQAHSWRPISPPLIVVWQTSLVFVAEGNVSLESIDTFTSDTTGVKDGRQMAHGSQPPCVRGCSPPFQPECCCSGEISSLSCSDLQPFTNNLALLVGAVPSGHLNYPLMFSSFPPIHSEGPFLSSDILSEVRVHGSEEVWSKRCAKDEKQGAPLTVTQRVWGI